MLEYTGIIQYIRFYSEETKYIVCSFETDEEDKPILVTGHMSYVNPHDRYKITGEYVVHPKYGKQFQLSSYEIIHASEEDEIIKYLSSPLFKGIGEVQAKAIVELLGTETLNLIKEDSHVLDQVRGMNEQKKQTIINVLCTQNYDQEVLSFFMGYGISTKKLAIIQATYQERTLEILQNRPYQLIDDIEGIGFKAADELAMKLGFTLDDPERIKAAALNALKECCFQTGSTYMYLQQIFPRFSKMIFSMNLETLEMIFDELIEERKVVLHKERYYPILLFEAEENITKTFKRYLHSSLYKYEEEECDDIVSKLEKSRSIQYDESQKHAMSEFLNNQALIITGGPGTGKTTIVEAIVHMCKSLYPDQTLSLVAPTGRASKRMSEVTGEEACTIHRLLKWDLHSNTFAMNKNNPLDTKILIIDEFSMVDTLLFSRLLEASHSVQKILLIGDDEQLPSVSPGTVLNDLMESGRVPLVQLTKVYRQASDSGIIQLAHSIRKNEYDHHVFDEYRDVSFLSCQPYHSKEIITRLIEQALQHGYEQNDIQVLAPMYNGVAGIDALNDYLQALFNPADTLYKQEIKVGRRIFREGDKILQLKNRVEDNVFNGDIGVLEEVHLKDNFEYLTDVLIVNFEGTYVEYTPAEFYTITHAYCMSIHKSQGNEFKMVIMPVFKDYRIMLKKNLLYTGLTRAKQNLFLIGDENAFDYGLKQVFDETRQSSLKEKMCEFTESLYNFE